MGLIGERVLRTEDPALLTGRGTFIENMRLDDEVHVVYVRSAVAHALVSSIDTATARAMPGVVDVVTHADLVADGLGPVPIDLPLLPESIRRPALAADRVRYVGEPLAVVLAETRAQAVDAAEAVLVDHEMLDAVVDSSAAERDEVLLFPDFGTNVMARIPTRVDANFDECEVVVEARLLNQRLAPSPLEARVAASRWEPAGADGERRLTHWQACQGAHTIQQPICEFYGLPASRVRVIVPDVGGGFGAKAFFYPEDLLLPWLARRVDRPVRYTETRTESMNGLGHGRAQVQQARLGGTRDGRLTAYSLHVLQDCGAWPRFGAYLPFMTRRMLTGTYDIANASFTSTSVVTNTVPTVAYRGAGRPEAAAAIERMVDLFAERIGMDPVEVRRRNLVPPERFPFLTATQTTYDSGNYPEALEMAVGAARYDELRREQVARRATADPVQIGVGVASYVEITAPSAGHEVGTVRMVTRDDGSPGAVVVTGTTPYGQGHRTTWAMLVSDRLGVPMANIEVRHGDTDVVPSSEVSGGSRSTQLGGTNVWRAAGQVEERARRLAARLLEADADDIVRTDDRFHVAGTPAVSRSWLEVMAEAERTGEDLHGEGDFSQSQGTFPSGVHVAVVAVATETGKVRLREMIAVDDAGNIVNPLLAEGQVHGGLLQGIGQALFEEVVYDADGNPVTGNFADYGFPSAAEVPSFRALHLATPSPLNDLGAKGIGESGTIGATPAVQNAVIDAVRHLGVRHIDLPCTPRRVWEAIQAAR